MNTATLQREAPAIAARMTSAAGFDDAAFHTFRATGIGGSDCAAALGMSPYKSAFALYLEKTGISPPEPENDYMRWGKILEPIVIREYERKTGHSVHRDLDTTRLRHADIPYMIANLDGLVVEPDRRVIEAKTARGGWNESQWGDEGTDGVPVPHLLQATHNMIVAGTDVCDIPVLIGGSQFRVYTVQRNEDLVQLVLEGEREFWNAVVSRAPPEPKTLEEVNERFRKSAYAKTVSFDDTTAEACVRLRALKDQMKALEVEAGACEFTIKSALGEYEAGAKDGVILATWKSNKMSRVFDAKRFAQENPEQADVYMIDKIGNRPLLIKV